MTEALRPELAAALDSLGRAVSKLDHCARCGAAPPTYIAVRSAERGTTIFGYAHRERFANLRRLPNSVEEMICDACVDSELHRRTQGKGQL